MVAGSYLGKRILDRVSERVFVVLIDVALRLWHAAHRPWLGRQRLRRRSSELWPAANQAPATNSPIP